MKSFKEFTATDTITYEQWCESLSYIDGDILSEGIFDNVKIPTSVLKIIAGIHQDIKKIVATLKVDVKDIITAFKEPHIFKVLKAVKFSIKALYNLIQSVYSVGIKALLRAFEAINKTKLLQKFKAGTIKIDEILDKHPILKKLTGPLVAGLLLYMWLNMTFVGDIDYDMDIGGMVAALMGKFSIEDLFGSAEGSMLIALFGTGFFFGLSVPWLGKATYNVVLALIYTGLKYSKTKSPTITKLKTVIQNA